MRSALPSLPSRAHAAALSAFALSGALAFVAPWLAVFPLAAFVLACAVAPYFPTWSFFLPTATRGSRARPEVALTFDDGPDPRTLRPLLELLAREKVTATFYVVGRRAAAEPGLLREAISGGHEIGNHSQTHDPLLMLRSIPRLQREVQECQDVLAEVGVEPLTFRPPVGITNPRLLPVLERLRLRCVAFSCRPLDFGNRRMEKLGERVLRRVRAGDIVLLHDSLPPEVAVTSWLDEVAAILAGLRARGLSIVPLSKLLGAPVMLRVEAPGMGAPAETVGNPTPSAERADADASSLLRALFTAAQAIFAVGYPFLVLGSVTWLGARHAALLLLALLALTRARSLGRDLARARGLLGLWLAVAALLVVSALLDDTRYMLAYPTLVNAAFLAQFAWSLYRGPSTAERFARMEVPDLTADEVHYCRSVTGIWCAFFVLNGAAAAALAVAAPRSWWAYYTGGVSYALVGILFAAEYLVRKARFGRYGRGPVDRVLARVLGNAGVAR